MVNASRHTEREYISSEGGDSGIIDAAVCFMIRLKNKGGNYA